MQVELTVDQKAFARRAVQTGRLRDEEQVIEEALVLWEGRERARFEMLTMIEVAEASLARGEGRLITEGSMLELAAEVKQRGRARLEAETNARS